MKMTKGVVLKNSPGYVYLLTSDGEFQKVPCGNQVFPPGTEIEIPCPHPSRAILRYLAAAAVFVIVIALSALAPLILPQQEAYLALDINPSILLSLNDRALVLGAEALNQDGEILLQDLQLKGKPAVDALTDILGTAYLHQYLSREKENAIYISLAAPPDYGLSEESLRLLAVKEINRLEINTYLKVNGTEMDIALEAIQNHTSINSVLLQEELIESGVWKDVPSLPEQTAPPLPVRKIVENAGSENVFQAEEYVSGRKAGGDLPGHAGPEDPVFEPCQKGLPHQQEPAAAPDRTGGEDPVSEPEQLPRQQQAGDTHRTQQEPSDTGDDALSHPQAEDDHGNTHRKQESPLPNR